MGSRRDGGGAEHLRATTGKNRGGASPVVSVASLNSPCAASRGVTFRDDFLIKVLPER